MKTHVVKTSPDATLSEAVDLMDIYQVNGLPVVEANGQLCGMITEHDILQALLAPGTRPCLAGSSDMHGLTACLTVSAGDAFVSEWMTSPAIFVTEDSDLSEAASLLLNRGLKRLPVVSVGGQVVGTLNRVDVFQALFEGLL